jgi:hypothetical protein
MSRTSRVKLLLSLLTCAASAACGVPGPGTSEDLAPRARGELAVSQETRAASSPSCAGRPLRDVHLARDVQPIFMSACSGEFCHRLTTPSRAYAFLVNQDSVECDDSRPLVTPGDPDRSYVVDKILDRNLCAGHPMPRGLENRLSPDEVRTVTDWICGGALDD